jgi:RimJ/RimL family protein N-acetyltransferase
MASLPEFRTDRLLLREVRLEDAEAGTRHFVDYEVISHLSDVVPWPYPEGGVADYFKNRILPYQGKDKWVWGIFLKTNPDELIGVIDLWRAGNPENRGFWLGRKFWGRGIMTEAVTPITEYAFNELGFEKLIFSNALGNTRSRRVKEKAGARFLRTEPAKFVNPAYVEREVWELTKEDWLKFRAVASH